MVSMTSLAATARPWLFRPLVRVRARLLLLGPAFVAAIAYVDPGNFASNVTAGTRHGYLLLWVLVTANLSAGLIQYLSAKIGLVTGTSLAHLLGERLRAVPRAGFWLQAEAVVMATDVAEVVGGAVALRMLFGWPLVLGGLVTGVVSTGLLLVRDQCGRRAFEIVLTGLLGAIAAGFVLADLTSPPSWPGVAHGLVPHMAGTDSVMLASAIIGATVMPHAVYLHSALAPRDRHRRPTADVSTEVSGARLDVGAAMVLAGGVNVAMLLFAARATYGTPGLDTLADAHTAIARNAGAACGLVFAVALLISGFAATAVGNHAGAVVMDGLLGRRVPPAVRRLVTLVPAVAVLGCGFPPTQALVVSQIVLAFGVPFAILPLIRLTADRALMGRHANRRVTSITASLAAVGIVAVNAALLVMTVA